MSLVLDEFYKNLKVSYICTQMDDSLSPLLYSVLPLSISISLFPSFPPFTFSHLSLTLSISLDLPASIPPSLPFPLSQAVGVSSLTGMGIEEFFKAVDEARAEYEK